MDTIPHTISAAEYMKGKEMLAVIVKEILRKTNRDYLLNDDFAAFISRVENNVFALGGNVESRQIAGLTIELWIELQALKEN